MRNLLVLVVLFVAIGGIAWWQVNQNSTQKDTYSNNKHAMFAVEDVDQIQRVFLADRNGRQALVEREEGLHWTYTNKATGKQYRANPSAIHTLLETIQRLRVRETVNKAATPNAVRSLATDATKVEIYGEGDTPLRVYYVGAMVNGATGNYIIMEDAEQPYIGYLPGFQGTIDTRYLLNEADWRDKAFIRLDPKALEFVEVAYQDPSQRAASFRINRKNANTYAVAPVDESVPKKPEETLNQANAETFMEDFDVVHSEMLLQDKAQRDTVITTMPFAVITYKANYHNEPQVVRIYPMVNPYADRGDGRPGHRQKIQRYFVDIDEDNFFLAQHLVIRSMLWGYDFFFQEAPVQLLEDEAETTQAFHNDKTYAPQRMRLIEDD